MYSLTDIFIASLKIIERQNALIKSNLAQILRSNEEFQLSIDAGDISHEHAQASLRANFFEKQQLQMSLLNNLHTVQKIIFEEREIFITKAKDLEVAMEGHNARKASGEMKSGEKDRLLGFSRKTLLESTRQS